MNNNETRFLLRQFGFKRLIRDKLLEGYYIFAKPTYTYFGLKNQGHLDFLRKLSNHQTVLIHNKNDEFCSPKIKDVVAKYKNIKYVELPGYHADYYINPEPYINLLH